MRLNCWTSTDEEKRKLRVYVATLQRSLDIQRKKRQKAEKTVGEWKRKYERLKREYDQLQEKHEKVKIQRDRYRDLLFKPNVSSKTKEEQSQTQGRRQEVAGSRNRGAKTGHPGHSRLRPTQVDRTFRLFLTHCPDCHQPLSRARATEDHLVEDIPPQEIIKVLTLLYQIERQWCPQCKKEVKVQPKFVIPHSRFGLNLITQILVLRYRAGQTIPKIAQQLTDTYQINLSAGGIINQLFKARVWLGPKYQQILDKIRAAPVKHADETGWRINGINSWVWTFLTKDEVYLAIEESRGKGVPQDKLAGSHQNDVLVRDDYPAYQKLPLKQQSCWAHLLRKTKDETEGENASDEVKQLYQQLKRMFALLKKTIDKPYQESTRSSLYQKMQKEIATLIRTDYLSKDTQRIQTRIRNQSDNLLTALLYRDVPLTNNLAERSLRPLVITRKMTGGSRSHQGAKTHAVNLSVIQTIQAQNKPLIPTLKQYLYEGATGKP